MAFVRLMKEDGTVLQDGLHDLVVFKVYIQPQRQNFKNHKTAVWEKANAPMTWLNVAGNSMIRLQRISEFSKDQNEGLIPVQDWYNEKLWLSQKLHLSKIPALRKFHFLFFVQLCDLGCYLKYSGSIYSIKVNPSIQNSESGQEIITDQTRWSEAK